MRQELRLGTPMLPAAHPHPNTGISCDLMTLSGGLRVGMHLISCYVYWWVKGFFFFLGPLQSACAFVQIRKRYLLWVN